jgi:hypothetical protein
MKREGENREGGRDETEIYRGIQLRGIVALLAGQARPYVFYNTEKVELVVVAWRFYYLKIGTQSSPCLRTEVYRYMDDSNREGLRKVIRHRVCIARSLGLLEH